MKYLLLTALGCLGCLVPVNCTAEFVNLKCTGDTGISSFDPQNNFGKSTDLIAGALSKGGVGRVLMRFGFAGNIPVNATITEVRLTMTVSKEAAAGGTGVDYELHRILKNWTEGTQTGDRGAPAAADESTWISARKGTSDWATPGGQAGTDFVATASATQKLDGSDVYTFASTPAMVADVQGWLAAPLANYGWMLISTAEDQAGNTRRVASRERAGSPTLTIIYTIPVPTANHPPAGADKTLTLLEDSTRAFTEADFGFSDPDDSPSNSLLAVKLTTLPLAGSLKLDGSAVTSGQSIAVADLKAGKLTYAPAPQASGLNYANFTFQVQDDGGTADGGLDLDSTPNQITLNVTSVNDAPSGADKTVAVSANAAYTFAEADFGFADLSDVPANGFAAVKLTTLPVKGSLKLDGAPATVGQLIDVADLKAGKLVFTPTLNETGTPYADFTFQVRDDGGTAPVGEDLDPTPNQITLNVNTFTAPPPVIDSFKLVGDTVELRFHADAGYMYAVEYRESLDDSASWTVLTNIIAKLISFDAVAVDGTSASPMRFYRLGIVGQVD